jgi:hypothetical protein
MTYEVTWYCWVKRTWLLHDIYLRPLDLIDQRTMFLSPEDPASYPWRPNFECLTTILQNKIFIFLIAKEVSSIIINNKLQFSRRFGVVSIYFSLKMWIWIIFQDLYNIIKKTNSRPSDRHTINKCCKNKSETRFQIKLSKPTNTHPVYVNWQTYIQGMYIKLGSLMLSAQIATEPSSLCHYKTHRLSLLCTCSRSLLNVFIVWPSTCSNWVMYYSLITNKVAIDVRSLVLCDIFHKTETRSRNFLKRILMYLLCIMYSSLSRPTYAQQYVSTIMCTM